ncbi:MAG: DNA translocase FtsK 4TM domain-containing protein [Sulfuricurvum sp.]|uniref:FtsK/SpoIIIE family DNA translocase n=1 Tax=Sulfuricurvum sp. TaxID=2025608 RepID=UPI00273368A9|nr:DNA translocase FtsK [Sulfuricurvum sp.]MDP2850507.1 DNA translocase FtsK 4TM domain-containing protein [Sulfuricurvum sp.]MDP3290649.1 DNA translocase FtsK 4TM domain-containing protein [Sulfuricurvum sp.]
MQGSTILRDTLFIAGFGILFYLGLATIIADPSIIGAYGATFALTNIQVFGYVAYTYLLLLMVPLFYWYKYDGGIHRRLEMSGVFALLFLALLFFQAMVVEGIYRGSLIGSLVDFLSIYIGAFGLWILWLMMVTVSVVLVMEQSLSELAQPIKEYMDKPLTVVKPVQTSTDTHPIAKTETYPLYEDTIHEEISSSFDENNIITPTIKSTVSSPTVEPIKDIIAEANPTNDVPAPIENIAKESTILSMAKKVKESKQHALVVDELEENKMLLDQIDKGVSEKPKNFKLPLVEFFQMPPKKQTLVDEAELDDKIRDLIEKLKHFNIEGDVVRTYAGPVVSTFEFKPAANIKVSKILGLQDDLAMALKAQTIRIQAPIPGKDVVGIEIPNKSVETIYLREMLESKLFQEAASPLTLILGKDIVGKPFITDLKKLPHLLIAGTTGSGKSVGINSMILSLLYKNSPDQLKLLMIDPKMLEFSIYNDIPHLLTPVITKPKEAISALNNMVYEMERRYQLMSETRTKNIENYNEKAKTEKLDPLPYIVVIIDELADLMMTSGKDVEYSIARLAQMARASGIHLIVATQRPSVDVVTGLIKANLPSRISYKVGQKIDSKIILDGMGAESLLGRGDMLFTPPGMSGLVRLHAPWSTEVEIEKVVDFLKAQREPEYDRKFLRDKEEMVTSNGNNGNDEESDELYEEAKNIILTEQKTSISYLQRRLQIGYNRSARLIEQLENNGILSSPNSKGNRDIIVNDPF